MSLSFPVTFCMILASFGNQPSGTGSVKFTPVSGNDTMMKNGLQQSISTKHQCITAMKEYEGKSFEELRVDDYQAGRKGHGTYSSNFGNLLLAFDKNNDSFIVYNYCNAFLTTGNCSIAS